MVLGAENLYKSKPIETEKLQKITQSSEGRLIDFPKKTAKQSNEERWEAIDQAQRETEEINEKKGEKTLFDNITWKYLVSKTLKELAKSSKVELPTFEMITNKANTELSLDELFALKMVPYEKMQKLKSDLHDLISKMSFDMMLATPEKTANTAGPTDLTGQSLEFESLGRNNFSPVEEQFFSASTDQIANTEFENEFNRQLEEGVKNANKKPYIPWTSKVLDWPGKKISNLWEKVAAKKEEKQVKNIIASEKEVNTADSNYDRLLKLLKRLKDVYDIEMDENGKMGFFDRRQFTKLLNNENASDYATFKELTDKIVMLQATITNEKDPEHKVVQPMMGPRKTKN